MKRVLIKLFLFFIINTFLLNQVNAENKFDFYMNDFYTKSNKAKQILKEIQNEMKFGYKKKVCSRQIEAAKLGILANESLIKAFEITGIESPNTSINASQNRWKSLLNNCKNDN